MGTVLGGFPGDVWHGHDCCCGWWKVEYHRWQMLRLVTGNVRYRTVVV